MYCDKSKQGLIFFIFSYDFKKMCSGWNYRQEIRKYFYFCEHKAVAGDCEILKSKQQKLTQLAIFFDIDMKSVS